MIIYTISTINTQSSEQQGTFDLGLDLCAEEEEEEKDLAQSNVHFKFV